MALFKSTELKHTAASVEKSASILLKGHVTFWDATQVSIADEFDKYEPDENHIIAGVSKGAWNNHDFLYYWLKRLGPAKVYLTTWAISEIAMRNLVQFMNDGLIIELHALFDYRNTSRKPAELSFIENNATRIKLAKCHAKMLVIYSSIPVTLTGSANMTRNPRLENISVYFGEPAANFHRDIIIKEINDDTKYTDESE